MPLAEIAEEDRLITAHLLLRDPSVKDRWRRLTTLDVVSCSLAPGEHDIAKHPCDVQYSEESRQALIDFREFAGDENLRVNIVYKKEVEGSA